MQLLSAATNEDPNPNKGSEDPIITEGSALVPNAGPQGTIADNSDFTSGGEISTYIVQDGDTISSVASHFSVSVNTIVWANGLSKKSTLKPGSTLVVLPVSGVQHRVAKGETLSSIANTFHADSDDIASFNGLDAGAGIEVGDVLILPGGEIQSTPSATKPTKKPTTTSTAKTSGKKTSSSSTVRIKQGGGLTSIKGNPYKGGSGEEVDGYYTNPVIGGLLTQGVHGWNGVDLGAPSGTPVRAAAAGTVIVSRASGWNGGYGNYVVVSHGNGTQTLYSHLSTDGVSVGDSVSKGEVIGAVGRTGEATGNHLHFEVRGARSPFASCEENTRCSPE